MGPILFAKSFIHCAVWGTGLSLAAIYMIYPGLFINHNNKDTQENDEQFDEDPVNTNDQEPIDISTQISQKEKSLNLNSTSQIYFDLAKQEYKYVMFLVLQKDDQRIDFIKKHTNSSKIFNCQMNQGPMSNCAFYEIEKWKPNEIMGFITGFDKVYKIPSFLADSSYRLFSIHSNDETLLKLKGEKSPTIDINDKESNISSHLNPLILLNNNKIMWLNSMFESNKAD